MYLFSFQYESYRSNHSHIILGMIGIENVSPIYIPKNNFLGKSWKAFLLDSRKFSLQIKLLMFISSWYMLIQIPYCVDFWYQWNYDTLCFIKLFYNLEWAQSKLIYCFWRCFKKLHYVLCYFRYEDTKINHHYLQFVHIPVSKKSKHVIII